MTNPCLLCFHHCIEGSPRPRPLTRNGKTSESTTITGIAKEHFRNVLRTWCHTLAWCLACEVTLRHNRAGLGAEVLTERSSGPSAFMALIVTNHPSHPSALVTVLGLGPMKLPVSLPIRRRWIEHTTKCKNAATTAPLGISFVVQKYTLATETCDRVIGPQAPDRVSCSSFLWPTVANTRDLLVHRSRDLGHLKPSGNATTNITDMTTTLGYGAWISQYMDGIRMMSSDRKYSMRTNGCNLDELKLHRLASIMRGAKWSGYLTLNAPVPYLFATLRVPRGR